MHQKQIHYLINVQLPEQSADVQCSICTCWLSIITFATESLSVFWGSWLRPHRSPDHGPSDGHANLRCVTANVKTPADERPAAPLIFPRPCVIDRSPDGSSQQINVQFVAPAHRHQSNSIPMSSADILRQNNTKTWSRSEKHEAKQCFLGLENNSHLQQATGGSLQLQDGPMP